MAFLKEEVDNEQRLALVLQGFDWSTAKSSGKSRSQDVPTASILLNGQEQKSCVFCKGAHATSSCSRARMIGIKERETLVAKARLCFRCLEKGHTARFCKATVPCLVCGQKHQTVMCPYLTSEHEATGKSPSPVQACSNGGVMASQQERKGKKHVLHSLVQHAVPLPRRLKKDLSRGSAQAQEGQADPSSRDSNVAKLRASRWWEGQSWPLNPEELWPVVREEYGDDDIKAKRRKVLGRAKLTSEEWFTAPTSTRNDFARRRLRKKRPPTQELKVGDMVLIGDDDRKRLNWPLGRVMDIITGCDGVPRVAKIRTRSGILVRPIQRIFRLESQMEHEDPPDPPSRDQPDLQRHTDSGTPAGTDDARKTRSGRTCRQPRRYPLL